MGEAPGLGEVLLLLEPQGLGGVVKAPSSLHDGTCFAS
jgi:hypothetical protein